MKLRNFLYLNTKVIEDYIAAIDGYTYDYFLLGTL